VHVFYYVEAVDEHEKLHEEKKQGDGKRRQQRRFFVEPDKIDWFWLIHNVANIAKKGKPDRRIKVCQEACRVLKKKKKLYSVRGDCPVPIFPFFPSGGRYKARLHG
jgi:hypothetical protein